jgi:hypothetical protein
MSRHELHLIEDGDRFNGRAGSARSIDGRAQRSFLVRSLAGLGAITAIAAAWTTLARADSPPVGTLPPGQTATLVTHQGELVAFALPGRKSGLVWRIARNANPKVLVQVSEANVGSSVVLVFRATGVGTTGLTVGLTKGETTKALDGRRFSIRVR